MNKILNDNVSKTEILKEEFDSVLSCYKDVAADYKKAVDVCMLLSHNQGGIETDGRGVRSSRIFTRQTITAMTLMSILPGTEHSHLTKIFFCDLNSIATLSRNIIDGYYCLLFFGIEDVTDEEADLRFHLYQYHTNVEKKAIFHNSKNDDKEYQEIISKQKNLIRSHKCITCLKSHQQKKIKSLSYMYKSKKDYENERKECHQLTRSYRLLSNFSHPTRLAIERINNFNGRGDMTPLDCSYIIMFVGMATKYLSLTICGYTEKFPFLKEAFSKELNGIKKFNEIVIFPE